MEYSSKLYLPKTFQFLVNEKVAIISARTSFEEEFPGDFHRWKVEAFKSVKKHFDTDVRFKAHAADHQPHVRWGLQHRDGSGTDPGEGVHSDPRQDYKVPVEPEARRTGETAGAGLR